ncbi:hypothetical protein [Cryptosporangium phraense]|uniref:Uncharacterized protein n=1 Tax=Cryptosporangium phraense TaxID=2593070 RepID=A0A545ASQ5_9ACTN|nr:hypothetical protein [Cryptosporangium phraense]TQS44333.1 hypothetical protein FL583_15485 [Cryptosporangium phraense]
MATATADRRILTVPSWATTVGCFYIENPGRHEGRVEVGSETVATMTARSISASTQLGRRVHVFDDHGRSTGYALDGEWHPAVTR